MPAHRRFAGRSRRHEHADRGVHVGTDFEALLDRIKPVVAPPGDEPDPPGHEKQKAFENKIRGEIKKLLSKENLKSFAGVLLEVLRSKDREPNEIAPKNDVRSGRDPPDVEELIKKLWMPDDPLEMIGRLHKATSKYLKVLGESGNVVSEEHIVWKAAIRILGYLVICLVSRGWLASPQAKRNPYYDIPVERLGSIEIVSARLAEIPASLALSGSMIHGAYCINMCPDDLHFPHTYHPESGWKVDPTVGEIEKMVFKVVFPDRDVRREFTNVDRDELNDTLKINREDEDDTKNYYLAIDKNSASHPLCNHEICIALDGVLNELPIIHFGRGAEGQLPLNKEGVVHSRIGKFLQLINQYQ